MDRKPNPPSLYALYAERHPKLCATMANGIIQAIRFRLLQPQDTVSNGFVGGVMSASDGGTQAEANVQPHRDLVTSARQGHARRRVYT